MAIIVSRFALFVLWVSSKMYPHDALTIVGSNGAFNNGGFITPLSTSTPYTILHAEVNFTSTLLTTPINTVGVISMYCGSQDFSSMRNGKDATSKYEMQLKFDGRYVCSSDFKLGASYTGNSQITYSITYVPYNLASSTSMVNVNFDQINFFLGFFLAFVSMIFVVWYFRPKKM